MQCMYYVHLVKFYYVLLEYCCVTIYSTELQYLRQFPPPQKIFIMVVCAFSLATSHLFFRLQFSIIRYICGNVPSSYLFTQ